MSDLQIILILLGAVIIASVVIYNWLQERKLRENITEDFIVPKKDVLTEDFYVDADALVDEEFKNDARKAEIVEKLNKEEATADAIPTDSSAQEGAEPYIDKESLSEAPVAPEPEAAPAGHEETKISDEKAVAPETKVSDVAVEKDIVPAALEPNAETQSLPGEVHPQIDLTAFLYGPKGISKPTLKNLVNDTLKDLGAGIQLHGLDEAGQWHAVSDTADDIEYKQAAISIQLADRRGPLPSPVLNKFQFAVESIGLELNAHVEWQGKGAAAERAIALDEFCMDVDQLVSIHLVHGDTPIHGTKFKGLAESNNMKLKQGKYCAYVNDTDDQPQFILVNADEQVFTEEGLRNNVIISATFQMEVPKVANCDQTFSDMVAVAQNMAKNLGGQIVDDNQKVLSDLQIEKIKQQLKAIHATMVARSILPGSDSSMRLFS